LKIAYFDCSSGISGDMCLGALVDAGVPLKEIERGLRVLPVKGFKLEARKVKRASIAATKVNVSIQKSEARSQKSEAKKWKDIKGIINESPLPPQIKQKGLKIFRLLFEAEGKVHGEGYHRAHLHELGAVDCIVDIFGTLIALELLGIDRVFSSAVNLGSGSVMTAHGRLPVPAPATAELMKGIPVYSSDVPFELTTPTGAAILSGVTDKFVPLPPVKIEKTGYGAGQKDLLRTPNVLRIFLGEDISPKGSKDLSRVTVVETNIDDMNPQVYEYVMERLFDSGALDVTLTQVIMKKGRPGIVLTVLCDEERRTDITDILFRETTTIGVRFYEAQRTALKREIRKINTKFGKVRVKRSAMPDGTLKLSPEYEDCGRTARKYGKSLLETMQQVKSVLGERKDTLKGK
jgi:uncharacterized protein (TIGR00299 family) protein